MSLKALSLTVIQSVVCLLRGKFRHKPGRSKCFAGFILFLSLILSLILNVFVTPAIGQPNPSQAPVIVDGQEIFQVSKTENFTAQERADLINLQLAAVVESGVFPRVEVTERNASTVIVANTRYLLTVTEEDLQTNDSLDRQADSLNRQAAIWAQSLQTSLEQAYQERRPRYLGWAVAQSLAIVVGTSVLSWGLRRFWERLLNHPLLHRRRSVEPTEVDHFASQSETRLETNYLETIAENSELPPIRQEHTESAQAELDQNQGLKQLLTFLLVLAQTIIWLAAILYLANLFPVTRQLSYQIAQALSLAFTSPLLGIGETSYSVVDLLILLILFWGLIVSAGMLTNLLRARILSLTRMPRGAQEVAATITRYILIFFGTIVLLQAWGLDLSSLALIGGALGVGIGFGLQDIARDFSSGLVLLFERSIQAGDFIEVDRYMGTVERVGARSIVLRTLDQISVIVPNSAFISNHVINWSHENPVSRLRLPMPVAYGSDVETVRSCLLQAAKEHPKVRVIPPPKAVFLGYGDNALKFELFVWIAEPAAQLPITSDLYFRVEELYRKHQVKVPFPQRDLHLRSGTVPLTLSPDLQSSLTTLLECLSNSLPESSTKDQE